MRASRLILYVTPLAHTSCAGSTGGRRGASAASPGGRPSRKFRTSAAGSASKRSSANSDGTYRPSRAQRAPPSVRCLDRYMDRLLSRAMPQTITTAARLRGMPATVSVGFAPEGSFGERLLRSSVREALRRRALRRPRRCGVPGSGPRSADHALHGPRGARRSGGDDAGGGGGRGRRNAIRAAGGGDRRPGGRRGGRRLRRAREGRQGGSRAGGTGRRRDARRSLGAPPRPLIRGGEDGDPAWHPPDRVRSGGSLHVPVPPRRGGPHGPGGHRPRRDAGGGHNPVYGGDRALAGGHRRGHRQRRGRGPLRRQPGAEGEASVSVVLVRRARPGLDREQ